MNKEITCRMIDGKPVVSYKEEYVPNRGDIVIAREGNIVWMGIFQEKNTSAFILRNLVPLHYKVDFVVYSKNTMLAHKLSIDEYSFSKATPEESEVMHHILNENGYQLVNGEVKEKRWVPAMDEKYWHMVASPSGIVFTDTKRSQIEDHYYANVFKTEQAALFAANKLNELLLTLPQE